MAKKRKQLYRAKRYRLDKPIEKRRNDPNYKPITFREEIALYQKLEDGFNERSRMIMKKESEKLKKEINPSGETVPNISVPWNPVEYETKFMGCFLNP